MKKLAEQIRNNIAQRKKNRRLTTILTAIAGILVFITVYTLILPALALEQDVHCGKEAHEHTDACYEKVLMCGKEEHTHGEGCYDDEGNLICDKEEHSHDESCYESKLVCGKERHVHTESCYKNPEAEELTNAGTQMQNEKFGTSVSEEDKTDSNSTETVNNKKEDKKEDINTSSDSKKDNKTDKDNKDSADQNEIVQGQEEKLVTMDISDYMTDDTGLWYYRPSEKAKASWKEVDKDTTLRKKDLVCLHLALRFKKGAVTDNISETVYELPENVEITDVVAKWLNDDDHGMNQLILGKSTPDKNSKGKKYLAGKYEIARNNETDKWELTVDWDSYMITQNAKKPMDVWADMYVTAKALKPMEDNSNKVVFAEKTKKHKEISTEYAAVKDETDKRKGALAINLSDYMTMGTGMWYYRASDKEKASWNRVREGSVLKEKDLVCVHLAMRFKKGTVTKATYDTKYTLPANIEFTDVIANWHNNEDRGMDQLILGAATPDNPSGSDSTGAGTYAISQNEDSGSWVMTVDWTPAMIAENAVGDVSVWADIYVTGKSLHPDEDGSNIVVFSHSNLDDRIVATVFDGVEEEDKQSEDQSALESDDQSGKMSEQNTGAEDIGAGDDQQSEQDTGEEATTEGEKVEEGSETTTAAEPADEATTEAVDATAPADETNTEAAPETSTGSSEDTTEAPAAPVDPKDQAVAGDLFYDGPDYTVSVSYGPEVGLPADVKLDVREIKEDSQSKAEQKEYADYFDQASEAIKNENKADVKSARFFDITFIDGQKEIEPSAPINVKIQYKKAEAIEDNQEVAAVHLPDKADNEVLSDVEVQKAGDGVKEVEFTADSFSVYGIVYTVDYYINGYEFHMPGSGTMKLSELFRQLKINEDVHNVEKVDFTDETLLKITADWHLGFVGSYDWTIKSLKPFTTWEKLTVTMKDGTVYEIDVTDSQTTGFDVEINFFDYDGTTPVTVPPVDGNYYLIVAGTDFGKDAMNGCPANTLWAIRKLDNFAGNTTPQTISIEKFNNDQNAVNNARSYDSLSQEEKNKLKVRLVYSSQNIGTLADLKQLANNDQNDHKYSTMMNSGIEGYDVMNTTGWSDGISCDYQVNIKKGNTKEFDVKLTFTDEPGIISANKDFYVLLDATSQDGNNHYYKAVPLVTDGSSSTVYLPVTGKWSDDQTYSENWSNITAKIVKPYNGNDLTVPNNCKGDQKYVTAYNLGDYSFTDFSQNKNGLITETDDTNHITRTEYQFNLSRVNLEEAVHPDYILGEAVEFGIVANKYKQEGHTETNFAVNYFEGNGTNMDIDGSGEGAIPFYVGKIENQMWISEKTKTPVDIFMTAEDDDHDSDTQLDHRKLRLTTTKPVEIIHMTQSEIKTYVDGLIRYGQDMSIAMAAKSTVKPVMDNDNIRQLDFRDYPDNTTIYVDCTNINEKIIKTQGWNIYKLENQSIVFNIPGESAYVGEFYVSVYDTDGTLKVDKVQSTTQALDADQTHNKLVDDVILNHITFNAYQATTFETKNASAVFLAPFAETAKQENGAGWILAKGTVDSKAEWHFYYHYRKYVSVSEGDLVLFSKTLKDSDGNTIPFSSNTEFEFKLTQTDKDWKALENGEVKTVTTNAAGEVKFRAFKYTNEQLDKDTDPTKYLPTSFYYVIKEQHPSSATKGEDGFYYLNGIKYGNTKYKIRVLATDDGNGKINCKFYKVNDDNAEEELNPQQMFAGIGIYSLGPYDNTVATGSAKIDGQKEIKNLDGTTRQITAEDVGAYSFKLEAITSGAPMPENTTVKMESPDNPAFSFGDIKFSLTDLTMNNGVPQETTFSYKIVETGQRTGITNDARTHTVNIKVSANENNPLLLDTSVEYFINGTKIDNAKYDLFSNTYETTTSTTLEGTKTLTGRKMTDSEFTFNAVLTKTMINGNEATYSTDEDRAAFKYASASAVGHNAAQETPDANDSNSYTGTITFDELVFKKPGEYTYLITEDTSNLPAGVTQTGTQSFTATITVVADENGDLSVNQPIQYSAPVAFTNTWTKPDGYSLDVTKNWKDASNRDTDGQDVEIQLIRHRISDTASTNSSDQNSESDNSAGIKLPSSDAWGKPINIIGNDSLDNIAIGKTIRLVVSRTNGSVDSGLKLKVRADYNWTWPGSYVEEITAIVEGNSHIFEVPYKSEYGRYVTIDFATLTGSTDYTWNIGYVVLEDTITIPSDNDDEGDVMKPDSQGTNYEVDSSGEYCFPLSPNQTIHFENLPYNDGNGTSYTYEVREVTQGAWTTTVTYYQNGQEVEKYNPAPADTDAAGSSGTVTIINKTTDNRKKNFGFVKVWKDDNGSGYATWQKNITVNLYRKSKADGSSEEPVKAITIANGDATAEGLDITSTPPETGKENQGYQFTITGLDYYDSNGFEYDYYVKEAEVEGYNISYGFFQGDSDERTPTVGVNQTNASDGQVIINTSESNVELPSTGGIGTDVFRFAGIMLIVFAGTALAFRAFRRKQSL
ncbi:MAG: Cna B-type domain-containing protein [Eubacterium sp.]|nr:Cna B-type domain-containing protein [Eubacterium sp.]